MTGNQNLEASGFSEGASARPPWWRARSRQERRLLAETPNSAATVLRGRPFWRRRSTACWRKTGS